MPFMDWNGADPVQNKRALGIIESRVGKDSPAAISLRKEIARQRFKHELKAWSPLLITLAAVFLLWLGQWAFPRICLAYFQAIGH